jgi:hypothetical protein
MGGETLTGGVNKSVTWFATVSDADDSEVKGGRRGHIWYNVVTNPCERNESASES